jgi:glutathione S-transferase
VWGIAERRLGAREWAVGRYSIADIHLFRLYWRFATSLRRRPGRVGTKRTTGGHCEAREARRGNLPQA